MAVLGPSERSRIYNNIGWIKAMVLSGNGTSGINVEQSCSVSNPDCAGFESYRGHDG
jgi:hypothetical protein